MTKEEQKMLIDLEKERGRAFDLYKAAEKISRKAEMDATWNRVNELDRMIDDFVFNGLAKTANNLSAVRKELDAITISLS